MSPVGLVFTELRQEARLNLLRQILIGELLQLK